MSDNLNFLFERFIHFRFQLLIIISIAAIGLVCLRILSGKLKEKIKNSEWVIKNRLKLSLIVGIPMEYVVVPFVEELIFRAPIIILFQIINSSAWIGIVLSGVVFGLTHYFKAHIYFWDIEKKLKAGINIEEASVEFSKLNTGMIKSRKGISVIATGILGIICGYFGIKHQSILLSVGIHAAWNIIMPVAVLVFILLLNLFLLGVSMVYEKLTTSSLLKYIRSSIGNKLSKSLFFVSKKILNVYSLEMLSKILMSKKNDLQVDIVEYWKSGAVAKGRCAYCSEEREGKMFHFFWGVDIYRKKGVMHLFLILLPLICMGQKHSTSFAP